MKDACFLDAALSHWATQRADATAVRVMGQLTSYAELDAHANKVASVLLALGVSHGDRVVLHAIKSVHAIAAVYGILRIGAIYVPIDPTAPPERVKAQIKATQSSCLLADTAREKRLAEIYPELPRLDISQTTRIEIDAEQIEKQAAARTPQDGAYILMTSGSTGTPKGILHTHHSGLAYANMAAQLCELAHTDRVSHQTPLHFDMSIFDIFSTAQVGACVVIIPEMHSKMPASLAKLVEQEQISVWYSVPYAILQLNERGALDKRDLSALRIVMFAGETMPPASLKSFAAHMPKAVFINAYGPSETNHCTSAKLRFDALDGLSAVPIGHPDAGVDAKIMHGNQEAQSGELLIASAQVMRGYWNNPELTAQSLVTLQDASGTMRTYYRTRDLVRRMADGSLALVGRVDRQIKLRGYRIELDEIERALSTTSGVSEAAVVFEDGHILAFVTGPNVPDASAIKQHIAKDLPPYAQPEHIHPLEQFSRTSTGKIDRKALIGHLNGSP